MSQELLSLSPFFLTILPGSDTAASPHDRRPLWLGSPTSRGLPAVKGRPQEPGGISHSLPWEPAGRNLLLKLLPRVRPKQYLPFLSRPQSQAEAQFRQISLWRELSTLGFLVEHR